MRITVKSKDLKTSIQSAYQTCNRRNSLPVLDNVKLSVVGMTLHVESTDLENYFLDLVRLESVQKTTESTKILVNCKDLKETLSLAGKNSELDLTFDVDSLVVQENGNCLNALNRGAELTDYPERHDIGTYNSTTQNSTSMPCDDMFSLLESVAFAQSKDESRYHLNGIFLENIGKKNLLAVATNGYRLSVNEIQVDSPLTLNDCILPSKSIKLAMRLLKAHRGQTFDIVQSPKDNMLVFIIGLTQLQVKCIDGKYPNYKQLIPASHKIKTVVNTKALQSLVKVAKINNKAQDNMSKSCTWIVSKDQFKVDLGNDNSSHIETLKGYCGETPLIIGLNWEYLEQHLKTVSAETVSLEFQDHISPVAIKMNNQTGVIMPMRLT